VRTTTTLYLITAGDNRIGKLITDGRPHRRPAGVSVDVDTTELLFLYVGVPSSVSSIIRPEVFFFIVRGPCTDDAKLAIADLVARR
jgi:hypothetical protein